MVRVVPCIRYHHVLYQTTVCAQDLVGPGVHLSASAAHAPRPTALQPRLVPWEEVPAQIFQAPRGHGHPNLLVLSPPLWRYQVGIKIADHQKRAPRGLWMMAATTSSIVEASSGAK